MGGMLLNISSQKQQIGNCSWLILYYTKNAGMCLHPFLRDDVFASLNIT